MRTDRPVRKGLRHDVRAGAVPPVSASRGRARRPARGRDRAAGNAADDPGENRRLLDRDRAVPPAGAADGMADRQASGLPQGPQGHRRRQSGHAQGLLRRGAPGHAPPRRSRHQQRDALRQDDGQRPGDGHRRRADRGPQDHGGPPGAEDYERSALWPSGHLHARREAAREHATPNCSSTWEETTTRGNMENAGHEIAAGSTCLSTFPIRWPGGSPSTSSWSRARETRCSTRAARFSRGVGGGGEVVFPWSSCGGSASDMGGPTSRGRSTSGSRRRPAGWRWDARVLISGTDRRPFRRGRRWPTARSSTCGGKQVRWIDTRNVPTAGTPRHHTSKRRRRRCCVVTWVSHTGAVPRLNEERRRRPASAAEDMSAPPA